MTWIKENYDRFLLALAALMLGVAAYARFSYLSVCFPNDAGLYIAMGKAVAAQLGPAHAIFLVNHGIVTVGADVREATVAAVLLEMACQQQMLTNGFPGWPTWSDEAESLSKREHIYGGDAVLSVWNYLERGLPPLGQRSRE